MPATTDPTVSSPKLFPGSACLRFFLALLSKMKALDDMIAVGARVNKSNARVLTREGVSPVRIITLVKKMNRAKEITGVAAKKRRRCFSFTPFKPHGKVAPREDNKSHIARNRPVMNSFPPQRQTISRSIINCKEELTKPVIKRSDLISLELFMEYNCLVNENLSILFLPSIPPDTSFIPGGITQKILHSPSTAIRHLGQ